MGARGGIQTGGDVDQGHGAVMGARRTKEKSGRKARSFPYSD